MRFVIGLDLGQTFDFTALVILERTDRGFDLRHLERFRDKSYVDVVSHVARLLERLESRFDRPSIEIRPGTFLPQPLALLAVDQTGVGRPVVDMFASAQLAARLLPITITSGHSVTGDANGCHVPKKDLVVSAKLLLQKGRLRISRGLKLTSILLKELDAFQVKITTSANETFGAWRENAHDDLVLALCLATWSGSKLGGQSVREGPPDAANEVLGDLDPINDRPESVFQDIKLDLESNL